MSVDVSYEDLREFMDNPEILDVVPHEYRNHVVDYVGEGNSPQGAVAAVVWETEGGEKEEIADKFGITVPTLTKAWEEIGSDAGFSRVHPQDRSSEDFLNEYLDDVPEHYQPLMRAWHNKTKQSKPAIMAAAISAELDPGRDEKHYAEQYGVTETTVSHARGVFVERYELLTANEEDYDDEQLERLAQAAVWPNRTPGTADEILGQ